MERFMTILTLGLVVGIVNANGGVDMAILACLFLILNQLIANGDKRD